MTDKHEPTLTPADADTAAQAGEEQQPQSRRDFLIGLGKWSRVVVAGAVFGGAALSQKPAQAAAWINRRGGWINGRGGSGGSWVNRRGGGGGSWINRR